MKQITLEQLLEAGCHFGHQVTRSNPRSRDFIYEARDNIHIIDLVKTKQYLEEAGDFIKSIGEKQGSNIIVIGTKRQARAIVEDALKQVDEQGAGEGLFNITNRWVGGLLTNFQEVSKNFKKLKDFEENLQSDEFKAKYTKKEIGLWTKDKDKLNNLYGGVADLDKKPDALFIIDSHLEELAVREAMQTGVATVAITDTNSNPDIIDYPIPANDDAVGSIKIIVDYIMGAWIEGRNNLAKQILKESKEAKDSKAKQEEKKETTEASKKGEVSKVSRGEEEEKVEKPSKSKVKKSNVKNTNKK